MTTPLETPVAGVLSGRTIGGRWRVGRLFGRSRHADVYEIEGHRELCLKVVMRGGQEASRHEAEVQAALGGRSNHIVPIVDCGTTSEHGLDETTYIVMPRATCTLEALVGKVAPRDCVHVVRSSLAGLDVAHKEGAFHRDIKPANIFVYGNPARLSEATIRIGDWGRVTAAGTDYTYGPVRHGTVAYEPPELLSLQEVGARSDLYMLGATVHVLLTSHLLDPLENGDESDPRQRAQRLLDKPVVVDSSCPPEWRHFVLSACQRRRESRGSLEDLAVMCDALDRHYRPLSPDRRQSAGPVNAAPPPLSEIPLEHEPPTCDQPSISGDRKPAPVVSEPNRTSSRRTRRLRNVAGIVLGAAVAVGALAAVRTTADDDRANGPRTSVATSLPDADDDADASAPTGAETTAPPTTMTAASPESADPPSPVPGAEVTHYCLCTGPREGLAQLKLKARIRNPSDQPYELSGSQLYNKIGLVVATEPTGWTSPWAETTGEPRLLDNRDSWVIPPNLRERSEVVQGEPGYATFETHWADPLVIAPGDEYYDPAPFEGDLVFYLPYDAATGDAPAILGLALFDDSGQMLSMTDVFAGVDASPRTF